MNGHFHLILKVIYAGVIKEIPDIFLSILVHNQNEQLQLLPLYFNISLTIF